MSHSFSGKEWPKPKPRPVSRAEAAAADAERSTGVRVAVMLAHAVAVASLWATNWFETMQRPKLPPMQVALLSPAEVDAMLKEADSEAGQALKAPPDEPEAPPEPDVPEEANVTPPVAVLPPEPVRVPPPPSPQPTPPPPPEPVVPAPPKPAPPKPTPPKPPPPKPEPIPPEPDVKAVVKPPPKPEPAKPVPPKPEPAKPTPAKPVAPKPVAPKPVPLKPVPAKPAPAPPAPVKPTPLKPLKPIAAAPSPDDTAKRLDDIRRRMVKPTGAAAVSNPFVNLRAPTAGEIAARLGSRIRNVSLSNVRSDGPAGSTVQMADFFAIVQSKLYNAWRQPSRSEVGGGQPTVTVSVTVLADGTLQATRLVSRSGRTAMDGSVSAALSQVGRLPPLKNFGIPSASLTMEVVFELD